MSDKPQAGEAAKLVTARSAQRAINFLGLEASPGRLAEATAMLESPTQVQGAECKAGGPCRFRGLASKELIAEHKTATESQGAAPAAGEVTASVQAVPEEVAKFAVLFVANGYRGSFYGAKTVFDWVHSLTKEQKT